MHWFKWPQPILGCLGLSSGSPSDYSFLIMKTLLARGNGSSAWSPATQVREADGMWGSQL